MRLSNRFRRHHHHHSHVASHTSLNLCAIFIHFAHNFLVSVNADHSIPLQCEKREKNIDWKSILDRQIYRLFDHHLK